jgi:predicted lactoylglutathione lyase
MSRKLFVNLPVSDLKRSIDFFTQLGFTFDPQFTDDSATCMLLSDEAFVMLLVEPRFSDFVTKQICDTTTHTEVIMCVSADSREEVDALVHKALAAGGKPSNDPIDHGFMYGWSFQDPDGHLWEVMYMDPSGMPEQ